MGFLQQGNKAGSRLRDDAKLDFMRTRASAIGSIRSRRSEKDESDGSGNFSATPDLSGIAGRTHGQTISGTYSVTSNGTGTIGTND
jgi:hypothetical protein